MALQKALPDFVLTLNLILLSLGKVVGKQACVLPKSPAPVPLCSLSLLGWEVAHGLKNGHFHSAEVVLCTHEACDSTPMSSRSCMSLSSY